MTFEELQDFLKENETLSLEQIKDILWKLDEGGEVERKKWATQYQNYECDVGSFMYYAGIADGKHELTKGALCLLSRLENKEAK